MNNNRTGPQIARVVAQYRGKYRIRVEQGEYWAEITGKMNYRAKTPLDYPVVGDLVDIYLSNGDKAVINEILPRKSILKRKAAGKNQVQPIAANIDHAFIVQALDRDFNLNRFERYLALAAAGKIKPILVLNKTDLISQSEIADILHQIKIRFGKIDVMLASVLTGKGIKELGAAVKNGEICCFVGSSGVGKSSIINKLIGKNILKTQKISVYTNKGRHVTTHRELFLLKNGGMVIDNPGMREVGLAGAGAGVKSVFVDISELAKECKFVNCTHDHEPGCAVLAAVERGEVRQEQYDNFIKLKKESDYYAMTDLEKRHKDRRFGRMVKNFKKFKKQSK